MTFTIAVICLTTLFTGCSEDELPTTGALLINIDRGDSLEGLSYGIYTEVYLTRNTFVPPLIEGVIRGDEVRIDGLNPGNYVLVLDAGTNWHIMLQVTAGQEREFTID